MSGTYAIIVTQNGNIFEYILGNAAIGTNVTSDITIISSNILTSSVDNLTYCNVIITRSITGSSDSEYTFPIVANSNISMIWAQGDGVDWSPSGWNGRRYTCN